MLYFITSSKEFLVLQAKGFVVARSEDRYDHNYGYSLEGKAIQEFYNSRQQNHQAQA